MDIRLKSLYIKDFNNIKEFDLDLDKDIISIFGDTGSAKSSIIEVIKYMLTGTLENRIVDYVRWGCKDFVIKGEFTVDLDKFYYEIKGGKKTDKLLVINDKDEYHNSDATKKLEEYIDPILMSFIISTQGKGDEILFSGGAERLQKFKKLAKLDNLVTLTDSMKDEKIEVNESIKEKTVKLDTLKNIRYTYQDVPDSVGDISSLKLTLKKLEDDLISYNDEMKRFEKYNENKLKYDSYILKKDGITLKLSDAKKRLDSVEIISPVSYDSKGHRELNEYYYDLKSELKDLETAWESYSKSLLGIGKSKKQIEENEDIITQNRLERLPRLSFIEDDLLLIEKEISKLNETRLFYKNRYDAIKDGKCPTCYAEYTARALDDDLEKLNELSEKLEICKEEYSNKKMSLSEVREIENRNEVKKVKIENAKKVIQGCDKVILELQDIIKPSKEIKDVEEIIKKTELKLGEFDKTAQEFEMYQNKKLEQDNYIRTLENDIIFCQKELENLEVIELPDKVEKPEEFPFELYEATRKDIDLYEHRIKERDNIIEFNKKIEKEEKETNKDILRLEKELHELKYKLTIINESIKVVDKEFTAWLIDKSSEFIKNKMNQFFNETYGRYEVSYENTGNSIDFYYNGEEDIKAPFSKASGYEKQILGTSFRLAIIQLSKSNLFVADEIDSNSKDERSLQLYEKILEQDYITQLISITHKPDTQEFLSNNLNCVAYELQEGKLLN